MQRKELSSYDTTRIEEALHSRHEAYLQEGESFEVSGYLSEHEVYAKFILSNEDKSLYYPVECKVDPEAAGLANPGEAFELLIDFQDYYFGRFFKEDRELYLTIDWGVVEFDEVKIYAKGQILNLQLEELADQLLSGEKLQ